MQCDLRRCPARSIDSRSSPRAAADSLRMADELMDVDHSGMRMDRPDLRRLLEHIAAHPVSYCVIATQDRLSEAPEDVADIDQALSDALVAIVVAADHTVRACD